MENKRSKDLEVSRCIDFRETEQELFLKVLNLGHYYVTKLKHIENMPIVRSGEFLPINITLVVTDTSIMVEGQGLVISVGCHGEVTPHNR